MFLDGCVAVKRILCGMWAVWLGVILAIAPMPSTWAAEPSEAVNPLQTTIPEQVSPNPSRLDAAAISSEKISQFVSAYLQVVDLMERREGELQGAETDSESLRVRQEIESDAFAIIEAAGLTWQEYLQLLGLANTDPDFGERIATQLQEATSSSTCC
jgi:hypothetical protein